MASSNGINGQLIDDRRRSYKNITKSLDELRRRRNDTVVELRKAKKDDSLLKKRNIGSVCEDDSPDSSNLSGLDEIINNIVKGINSDNENDHVNAARAARKILSKENNPPIDLLIQAGIIPKLVEFLSRHENPMLQFEAAWALTNVASGTSQQTLVVVNAGAVMPLIALVSSQCSNINEQAVWALGNIAGDGPETRDLILKYDAMPALLRLINPSTSVSVLRNLVWTISNLCRNKNPPPEFGLVKPALPHLANLLHYTDDDVLADTCWALSYLTDGDNYKIGEIVDSGVVPRLVQLLSSPVVLILTPALRIIGNIVTGNDKQTDAVIQAGALPFLGNLLMHQKISIQKEAAWALSNVLAGNQNQIQAVINAGILPTLVTVLAKGDMRAQKEAAWAVTNLASGGTSEQIHQLLTAGVLEPMCALLDISESKTVLVILDGLDHILQASNKDDQIDNVTMMIETYGGVEKLENLQQHENEQIYLKVSSIIDKYFMDDDLASSLADPPEDNNQLQFNAPSSTTNFNFL